MAHPCAMHSIDTEKHFLSAVGGPWGGFVVVPACILPLLMPGASSHRGYAFLACPAPSKAHQLSQGIERIFGTSETLNAHLG